MNYFFDEYFSTVNCFVLSATVKIILTAKSSQSTLKPVIFTVCLGAI